MRKSRRKRPFIVTIDIQVDAEPGIETCADAIDLVIQFMDDAGDHLSERYLELHDPVIKKCH